MSENRKDEISPSLTQISTLTQIPSSRHAAQNSLFQRHSMQNKIKEKDLNRILYEQDSNATPEQRIQHIQESVTQLPPSFLRNHLHLPISVNRSHDQNRNDQSQANSPKKIKPILSENMQQSMNKIRSALTPLNQKISQIVANCNKDRLNQSYDAQQQQQQQLQQYEQTTITNITTDCRRKRSVKQQESTKYTSLQGQSQKPPLSTAQDIREKYQKNSSLNCKNNSLNCKNVQNEEQFKNSYDIISNGKMSKVRVAQQTFKSLYNHNQSYTTRASTARSNTQRQMHQLSNDNNRTYKSIQSGKFNQVKTNRQNSFFINNSVEFFSTSNERQTVDSSQGQIGLSLAMTPYSIDITHDRPFTQQSQTVGQQSFAKRPKTHIKNRRNTCLETAFDQQPESRDHLNVSSTHIVTGQGQGQGQGQGYEGGEIIKQFQNHDDDNDTVDNQVQNIVEFASQATISCDKNLSRRNGVINMTRVNKNVEQMNQFTKEFLPSWIRKRSDFIRVYLQSQISKKLTIPKICLKSINERYISELSMLEEYLRKIKQLLDLSSDLMKSICQNLKVQIYWEGEKVISVGDDISYMFTIFEGELIECKEGNKIKILKQGELFFRNALIKDTKSDHDYVAASQCIILYIEKNDYQEIILNQQEKVLNNFKIDIRFQPLFKDFPKQTLIKLCETLKGRLYLKDEIIYEFQDSPQYFYIINEGQIRCETVFYMHNQNCWPKQNFEKVVDHDYHEYRTFSKTLKNEKILEKGSFFGDQEVIYDLGRMASTVAHTNCFLLSITKKEFFSIFTYKEINTFIQFRQNAPIKLEKNLKSIQKDQKNKDARKRIISALNILYESAPSKDKVEKIEQKIKAFKQYIQNKDFNEPEEN